jgi:hypothetical protein
MSDNDEYLKIILKDNKGRIVFKVINDNVMVMRLPDMDERLKDDLVDLYTDFTTEDPEKIRKFLNFESDGDNEFCS